MLMSARLKNTDRVIYHGFITSEGKKMSKSIGNVMNPLDLVSEFGTDSLRYFLSRHIHPYEDSDFTKEGFKEAYNGNLANSLGNLVSRVVAMVKNYDIKVAFEQTDEEIAASVDLKEWRDFLEKYQFSKAMDYIWGEIAGLEKYIAETEPYKLIKTDEEKAGGIIAYLTLRLWDISVMLVPFMPETSSKIQEYLVNREVSEPLFERKE
jgi:methionyl-tRNA synthetase